MREWRARNRKKWDAYMAEYRKRNRVRLLAYAQEHRIERKAIKHAYLARKYKADGRYTASEFRQLVEMYGGKCAYCGRVVALEADHVTPLSRGGTNYIDNILPACRSCNAAKRDRTADEFRAGEIYRRVPRTPAVPEGFKVCSGCKKMKPLTDYWKNKYHSLGVQSRCKVCSYIVHKDWLASPENREKRRASMRLWHANKKKH